MHFPSRRKIEVRLRRAVAGGAHPRRNLFFESPSEANKKRHPNGWRFCWQRMRDSNPRKRSQSPVCYRYTNPLSHGQRLLYAQRRKSQALFSKTLHIFSAPFKASLSHNKSIMQLHRLHDCVSRQIKAQSRHSHT